MSEELPEQRNRALSAREVEVLLVPVPEDEVEAGVPHQGTADLGTIGGCSVGIWELRQGTVTDTEIDEWFVVVSGSATIELLDEGRTVEVQSGDVMHLSAGTRTRWIVPNHIRKVYLSRTDSGGSGSDSSLA